MWPSAQARGSAARLLVEALGPGSFGDQSGIEGCATESVARQQEWKRCVRTFIWVWGYGEDAAMLESPTYRSPQIWNKSRKDLRSL